LLATLPMLVLFLFAQQQIIEGLTIESIRE
jgi:ABC-type maltose transport system permease subunit